ncbi:MAG TPA: tetratricopeptide repeat protein [Pirellulales bacterium]|jgi:tetratricopeptide (TPR) repeat protein
MATIFEQLTIALQHHQAGRRQAAEQMYRQILAVDPQQPDALHLLGVMAHEAGQHDVAIDYIRRAIELRETASVFHVNLGNAYQAQARRDEAVACFRRALTLNPDFPEAHCNLGNALRDQGKIAEAVESYHRALAIHRNYAEAHNNLGNAWQLQGRLDEAIACYRRALEARHDYAEAHNNLGTALLARQEPDEAVASYRRAIAAKTNYVEAYYNLGIALNSQGKHDLAVACYRTAIALRPDFIAAYNNLGNTWKEQGKISDAIACYRRALEINADFLDALNNLGNALQEQRELDGAVACFRRVIELNPDFVEVRNNLGCVLRDQGKHREAADCFRQILQLRPDFAEAQLGLGSLHEQLGEFAEAEAAFRTALQIQPSLAQPHGCLANLLRGKLSESDRVALEERIAEPELSPDPRAELSFALAQVLDAQGEYARAAGFLRQANTLQLQSQPGYRAYDPKTHEQLVDFLIQTFDREFFERIAGAGLDSRQPVFIFGLPRSGTTLVEQVLASHSQVYGAGELQLAHQTFAGIPAALARRNTPQQGTTLNGLAQNNTTRLDAPTLQLLASQHLERLQAIAGDHAQRIVDKMPDNYLHLGLLAAMFPRATFIHCRRTLADVALSCWMTNFFDIRWSNDFGHIAGRFRQYLRMMDHWQAVLPVSIHEVDYEEMVSNQEHVSRRLVAACGLDWEPACLEFYRTQRQVRTASSTQVRQPIYKRSLARWKNYEREVPELFKALPGNPI